LLMDHHDYEHHRRYDPYGSAGGPRSGSVQDASLMHHSLTFPDNELLMGGEDEEEQTGIIGPPSVNRSLTYPQMHGNLSIEGSIISHKHSQSSDAESDGIISQNYSFTKIYGAQSIVSANPTLSPTAMQKFSAVIAETQQQQQLDHLGFPLTTHQDDSEASYVDQLVEIDAPPGMLGIVVDSSLPGPPVIHAIKDNSVLKDKLFVGDRIVYFDGEDTAELSSMQLTRLIGSRSENPVRKFGVIRKVKSTDDSEGTPASWELDYPVGGVMAQASSPRSLT